MAQTRSRKRKRKRVSDILPLAAWHGDTIAVTPRRLIASKGPSERDSLTETHTRGNEALPTRVALQVETLITATHDRAPAKPSQASTEEPDRVTPPDCCYHCRTRGGNAAYECFKEERSDICTRCNKDKKKTCRIPTDEEMVTILGRCPQCTRRGFKICNGGDPCNTCSRNKTPHLCRKPAQKKVKRESAPTRRASTNESGLTVKKRPSRARRSEPAVHGLIEQDDDMALSIEHHDNENHAGTLGNGMSSPEQPRKLAESGLRGLFDDEKPTNLPQSSPVSAYLSKSVRGARRERTASIELPAEVYDQTREYYGRLPSRIASNDALQDTDFGPGSVSADEDMVMTEAPKAQLDHDLMPPSNTNGRPRRSRVRISYVEAIPDNISDQGRGLEDEEASDVYTSPTKDDESEPDALSEPTYLENELSVDSDADMLGQTTFDYNELSVEDEPTETAITVHKRSKVGSASQNRAGKGIDQSLPPLKNVEDSFSDMTTNAVLLGLGKALESLEGRSFKVATMCSGTESPLLALHEISKALQKQGYPPVNFQHEFSAEIEVFRQAYIQRNFRPKILFRDVRDFLRKDITKATTAYGAEVEIPIGIHILIAGFVCKDLSRMNSNNKTLEDGGESGDTWLAIYTYAKRFRPSIVLLENVRSERKIWDDIVSRWDKIGYEAAWVYCDSKNYYLPQTRERMYMIAIERSQFGTGVGKAVVRWKDVMQQLQRQCSSPYEAWLPDSLQELSDYSIPFSEPDWPLCKLRYDHIRSEERLGILSPVTRRSNNGTVRPPDFADRSFYISQSSRVSDAIDVAHLQRAHRGYDSLFKMSLWDVSQNVDRFKADVGIAPCITPGGMVFASNRQQALNGSQLLLLQGMPFDRLHFANETQRERQDLAGNAMSTTVIGASLIAALISACPSLRATSPLSAPCAGNPKHVYDEAMLSSRRTQTPDEFVRWWRPKLPARLKLTSFPDLRRLTSDFESNDQTTNAYVSVILKAQIDLQYFCIGDFARQHQAWKVTYCSPQATLELRLGHETQWLLFVKCPSHLPGNSPLRELLEAPIAQGIIRNSLLDVEWKLHVQCTKDCQVQISGSDERSSSWRSRLGLPDYREETVPTTIKIQSNDKDTDTLVGEYEHLPNCGTASNGLYRRSTHGAADLYLFLDPNPIGRPDHDRYVFSADHSRKHYGDPRLTLARVDPLWRPWNVSDQRPYQVHTTVSGVWVPVAMNLSSATVSIGAGVLSTKSLHQDALETCLQGIPFLDVILQESLPVHAFADYAWTLERPRLLPSFLSWQTVQTGTTRDCSCAPLYPTLIWSVDEKNGMATAHEDRKAAATFERAIKNRPPIFQLKATSDSSKTQIQVGINIMSLVHRAEGRLSGTSPVSTAWRLVTDHADLPPQPFAKFRLQSNSKDAAYAGPATPKYLRGAQLKSLTWMVGQELGKEITISETEEGVYSGLGWRAEARAQTTRTVRGGILADLPSFGKTVTTIGLIQSEFEKHTPEAIIHRNLTLTTGLPALLDSAATLIVCPPHIIMQWKSELENFLDADQYELYNVLLIQDCAQLKRVTIEDILRSKYVTELANFTAMPGPVMTSRRAFEAWMTRAMDEVPDRLAAQRSHNYEDFQQLTRELFEERLQHPEFKATLPLKISHGSAYKSFSATQSVSSTSRKFKAKGKVPFSRAAIGSVPLLHLFRYNRVVVDEYHYLNDVKKLGNGLAAVAIKKVAAHKRWILSGTPALANFSDVDQIASFLGIKLGRDFLGDGIVTTQTERVRKGDQTDVENFLSQTEVPSSQWHQARHDLAQEFLGHFVRQNEAELTHIRCTEQLLPIELNAAHHAIYLELTQHLISQKMQIKKLNNKLQSDRTDRLNESLESSSSAEEALLKSALLFQTEEGESGLELLMSKRSQQHRSTKVELMELLVGFEGLMGTERNKLGGQSKKPTKEPTIADLYGHFKKDIELQNWLGDPDATHSIKGMLARAEKTPKSNVFAELNKTSGAKRLRLIKKRLSQLREVALEFAHRTRSKRFVESIAEHLQFPTSQRENTFKCSSPQCDGTASISKLRSVPHCGHTACMNCLGSRADDEICVHPDCRSLVHDVNLIRMSDLGTSEGLSAGRSFGKKLGAIAQLIKKLPAHDQGIVFAPNQETIDILETVFDHHVISYHSPCRRGKRTVSADIIEDFKANKDLKQRKKVLILDLGSESAAGINLTNANHIIFVAPLLAKTQYDYDSAMAQAIARSRRYGQEKEVHVYHVVAQRTIDVDILEHRHKRVDGITTETSPMNMPGPTSAKKEKTKLVRNNAGQIALIPSSWLADESMRKTLGVGEKPDSLASLINFSETFEQDEEEFFDMAASYITSMIPNFSTEHLFLLFRLCQPLGAPGAVTGCTIWLTPFEY
ncbi:hypothetical protein EJ02DRAFT_511619 [Clathrospora elynae]|uniref:Helicase C-terminal domain-containing protein n=1 Tax=Clathrospora elynae TaxID=706981 RepID=A0A6A5SSB9_9PLEO|nr:hypothetical protein EJ02DRAFT_511619 [Clathrospora elynae]